MHTDRKALRKQLLAVRARSDQVHLKQVGQAIAHTVLTSTVYRQAGSVHCFAGALQKGEIDTLSLCTSILKDNKRLLMPVSRMRDRTLKHKQVTDLSQLKPNSWGIAEPVEGPWVDAVVDLVLVPGLAADRSGNRLGYGMGFYDRFLAGIPKNTVTMMLLEDRFLLDYIAAEPHDIAVSYIATETELITC